MATHTASTPQRKPLVTPGMLGWLSFLGLALLVGLTAALIVFPLALVVAVGRPDRFWHPGVYWNVHSVLWEITWCITIYLAILMIEFLPVVSELRLFDRYPRIRRIAHQVHKAAPVR